MFWRFLTLIVKSRLISVCCRCLLYTYIIYTLCTITAYGFTFPLPLFGYVPGLNSGNVIVINPPQQQVCLDLTFWTNLVFFKVSNFSCSQKQFFVDLTYMIKPKLIKLSLDKSSFHIWSITTIHHIIHMIVFIRSVNLTIGISNNARDTLTKSCVCMI